MRFNMHEKLTALSKRLKDEQRELLLAAAEQNTTPSASTIQRVAMLELNIAAVENTLADEK
jgi:cell division protein FtsL